MRSKTKQLLATFALFTFVAAAPVWGRPHPAHTATAYVTTTTTIGTTQLQPGEYELRVETDATQLQVVKEGKVVATVPVQWVQLTNKPAETTVLMDSNKITEVDFGGNIQAVQISSSQ